MASAETRMTGEDIISDSLGRGPDVQLGDAKEGWRLSRWRQFVGSYNLPSLPDPIFVVHIAGKPQVRTWQRDSWSEGASIPGCATIVPAGQPTGWLVDGELDVVTLSMANAELRNAPAARQFEAMQFAFADPLGVALTRQVLAELYAPSDDGREAYLGALVGALRAHMLRGPGHVQIPTADFSGYRLHKVLDAILEAPEAPHEIESLAALAGVSPSHFSRVFKQATGETPHRYVLKARIDRAKELLQQSGNSVRQIAEATGFQTQAEFARAFRRETGEAATEFRHRRVDRNGRKLQ
jgi:AraC family transcriptional regulator